MKDDYFLHELQSIVGEENCQVDEYDLYPFSTGYPEERKPHFIIRPEGNRELVEVIRLAAKERTLLIPEGARTGMMGIITDFPKAIVLSLARINRIIDIDIKDRVGVAEAGVITLHFQREVERYGLFYPPDPLSRSYCTLGGNVATNAGGPRRIKYGATRDYILGLEVAIPSGEVIKTGGRTIKNVTGYDLKNLFCGSFGTLGVIIKVIFKLLPKPDFRWSLLVGFRFIEEAQETISRLFNSGIIPSSLMFIESSSIQNYGGFNLEPPIKAECFILIDIDGYEESVNNIARKVEPLFLQKDPLHLQIGYGEGDSDRLWMINHLWVNSIIKKYGSIVNEDLTLPLTHLPAIIRRIRAISERYGIIINIMGTWGNGAFRLYYCFDPEREEEKKGFQMAREEVFQIVMELGGTMRRLSRPLSPDDSDSYSKVHPAVKGVTDSIKNSIDPKRIMDHPFIV
jgi:glycolate oxidase